MTDNEKRAANMALRYAIDYKIAMNHYLEIKELAENQEDFEYDYETFLNECVELAEELLESDGIDWSETAEDEAFWQERKVDSYNEKERQIDNELIDQYVFRNVEWEFDNSFDWHDSQRFLDWLYDKLDEAKNDLKEIGVEWEWREDND